MAESHNSSKAVLVILICSFIIAFGYFDFPKLIIDLPNYVQDAFGDSDSRKKLRFSGTHDMIIHAEPKIDFKVNLRTTDPFNVNADVRIGNYKINMFGGGMMKQFYLYNDNACKRIEGFEYLMSLSGDKIRLDFKGKICYLGGQVKLINLIFQGTNQKGVFLDAENISGTLTGSSNQYETNYNLHFNSILVYKNE